jgi:hypothetical protein
MSCNEILYSRHDHGGQACAWPDSGKLEKRIIPESALLIIDSYKPRDGRGRDSPTAKFSPAI